MIFAVKLFSAVAASWVLLDLMQSEQAESALVLAVCIALGIAALIFEHHDERVRIKAHSQNAGYAEGRRATIGANK